MIGSALLLGDDGYQIQRSLRLRASATAYLNRTFGTPTNATTFTFSCWVKRGKLTAQQYLFGASAAQFDGLILSPTDTLYWYSNNVAIISTTAVFRDPSAWYHIVVKCAGASNALYVNGVLVGSASTVATYLNTAITHIIGQNSSTNYLDGYLSEVNFIDGQALTPSSFGQIDATTGQWTAKKYTGTYGTNGFYLPFSDTTSTTTLCYDKSGNANHWTPNNISLTAGRTYDSVTDVPLAYGTTDRGNYCVANVLNSSDPAGGMTGMVWRADNTRICTGTLAMTSGKWVAEFDIESFDSNMAIGIAMTGHSFSNNYTSLNALNYVYVYQANALKGNNGTTSAYGATYNINDLIRVEYNADGGTLEFFKNGVSQGVAYSGIPAVGYVLAMQGYGSITPCKVHVNCGQRAYTGTPTTGFKALHTGNLPNTTVVVSGSFTGNLSADGPFVWCNGTPETLTINGNAVTFATHADKLANGFKLRTASSSYNASGTNTWTSTVLSPQHKSAFKYQLAKANP